MEKLKTKIINSLQCSDMVEQKIILIDEYIFNHYRAQVSSFLDNGIIYEVPSGESCKNITEFEKCINFILAHNITRGAHLFAIGGGSISDFAGFVASSLLRGLSWSVVPTTLLSMVDACLGGKTGLNTLHGKNLIGSFHHPDAVYLNLNFLTTLPEEENQSGRGEILKYCLLSKEISASVMNEEELDSVIHKCLAFKSSIVEQDFKESGLRACLNLGHTFGHAYEVKFGLAHGIAVILGIQTIDELFLDNSYKKDIESLLTALAIKIPPLKKLDREDIKRWVFKDKKRTARGIKLSLPFQKFEEYSEEEILERFDERT